PKIDQGPAVRVGGRQQGSVGGECQLLNERVWSDGCLPANAAGRRVPQHKLAVVTERREPPAAGRRDERSDADALRQWVLLDNAAGRDVPSLQRLFPAEGVGEYRPAVARQHEHALIERKPVAPRPGGHVPDGQVIARPWVGANGG